MSTRQGHSLIFDDLFVNIEFLKKEMEANTIMKLPSKFYQICFTPSYQICQKLFNVRLFDPSNFKSLSPRVLHNLYREKVYYIPLRTG